MQTAARVPSSRPFPPHRMGDGHTPTGVRVGPEPATVPDFVDVSGYQENVRWDVYAASGRSMAICKASEGRDWVDDSLRGNRRGLQKEGLYCGMYHFAGPSGGSRIGNPVVEANHFAETVGALGPKEFPVLDFEKTYGLTPSQQVDWIGKWCTRVEERTGKTPWLYTNSYLLSRMDARALTRYPLWIANYNSSDPERPPTSGPWPALTAWQFTDNARTPGIQGPTDRSYLYGDMSKLVPQPPPATPPAEPTPPPSA